MKIASAARLMSMAFLSLAVLLVAYGLYGLSHFAMYTGEYFDERLLLFDNGVYPFIWGIVTLIICQLARLRHHRSAMLIAVGTAFVLFVHMRVSIPSPIAGQAIFPDRSLLNQLIAICVVMFCLALADRSIQRLLRLIFGCSSPEGSE